MSITIAPPDPRNDAGFPISPHQPIDPAEGEFWVEDLPPAEAATLLAIQAGVAEATRGLVAKEAADYLAEETLWQIARQLRHSGRISLPEIGTIEALDTATGPVLVATASPLLRGPAGVAP